MVYGDGGQTRDFVYVEDVVHANVLACESKVAAGKVLNIAAGKSTSLNQLLDTQRIVTSTTINPIYADPRPGDIRDSVADTSLAKEILRYEPEVEVEKGLRAMLSLWRD